MICEKYQELTVEERVKFIGSITHACMSDDTFFDLAQKAIEKAAERGIFDGIQILPPPIPEMEPENLIE